MYGDIYSKSKDQPGKVANPARGQLNRENECFSLPVPRQPAHLHTQAESGAYLRDSSRIPWRRPFIYLKPPYAIGSVPSLSGHATAYRRRSLPRVRRHRASCPQRSSSNGCCLCRFHHGPNFVRLFFFFPHTHYWYEVGVLKIIAFSFNAPTSIASWRKSRCFLTRLLWNSIILTVRYTALRGFAGSCLGQSCTLSSSGKININVQGGQTILRKATIYYNNNHFKYRASLGYNLLLLRTRQSRDPISSGLTRWCMAVSINKWTPPRKSGGIP